MPPTYSQIFKYSFERKPPLNSFHCTASLSRKASSRFVQLTRAANASIGAGCFALVALAMMELEEVRHPDIPLSERRPFIAAFPLNPKRSSATVARQTLACLHSATASCYRF